MHRLRTLATASAAALLLGLAGPAAADMEAAEKWIDSEFQPSTLTKEQQLAEMEWFIKAAEPFKGMEINVVSETITTHEYESKVLAKAFSEITGIKLTHDLIGEGDVVEKLQTQMQSGRNIYDAYINDSDLIGTHFRYQQIVPLSDWMGNEGADVTNPGLDLGDFIGISFTTGPDGKIYQLPDQQFANLYWFRYDWFTDPDLKAKFKAKYGYELGVPVNWSDDAATAEFYTKGSLKRAKFSGSNLAGVTLFGADLTDADFTGADLTNANLGQCNLTGTIFKDANLSGAIVSGANMDELGDIDGSDWTDVIVRKDVNDKMCAKNPQGVNAVTGNPTAMSLFCN